MKFSCIDDQEPPLTSKKPKTQPTAPSPTLTSDLFNSNLTDREKSRLILADKTKRLHNCDRHPWSPKHLFAYHLYTTSVKLEFDSMPKSILDSRYFYKNRFLREIEADFFCWINNYSIKFSHLLKRVRKLESLQIIWGPWSAKGLQFLRHVKWKTLKSLRLPLRKDYNYVQKLSGILPKFKAVEQLSLDFGAINFTDELKNFLGHFCRLRSVKDLIIDSSRMKMPNAVRMCLNAFSNLRSVSLKAASTEKFDKDRLDVLLGGINRHRMLESLMLALDEAIVEPLFFESLTDTIKDLSLLQKLHLEFDSLVVTLQNRRLVSSLLLNRLEHLQTLELVFVSCVGINENLLLEACESLSGLKELQRLRLATRSCPCIQGKYLSTLAKLLSNATRENDSGLTSLLELTMELSMSTIDNDGLKEFSRSIANLHQLKTFELNLSGTLILLPGVLRTLSANLIRIKTLNELSLDVSHLPTLVQDDLESVFKALGELEDIRRLSLNIAGTNKRIKLEPVFFGLKDSLTKLTKLEGFTMNCSEMGNVTRTVVSPMIAGLSSATGLRTLKFVSNASNKMEEVFCDIVNFAGSLETLDELCLFSIASGLTDSSLKCFTRELNKLSELQRLSLDLKSNEFSWECMRAFITMLKQKFDFKKTIFLTMRESRLIGEETSMEIRKELKTMKIPEHWTIHA